MKRNLMVLSYDYDLSKRLAESLAETFSMRFFDQIEMFNFHNVPRDVSTMYRECGEEYTMKKLRSVVKMELDFDDAVFVADISLVDNCSDLFLKLKHSNFIIFLYKDTADEINELNSKEYSSPEEKALFSSDENVLTQRKLVVSSELADVRVNINGLLEDEILNEVIDGIKNYYAVD